VPLTVVVEQLGDEVDVSQDHATTAIASETELVDGLARSDTVLLKERTVLVPLVADNLGYQSES